MFDVPHLIRTEEDWEELSRHDMLEYIRQKQRKKHRLSA
jgi:hypothetical protein